MDDLISRKYTLEALGIFNDRENGNEHFLYGIETANEIVTNQYTVEAVPLEPLSMWLASYASPPYSAIKAVYDPKQSNMTNQFEAWKYQLRDLLKSGLMDTEESNVENK